MNGSASRELHCAVGVLLTVPTAQGVMPHWDESIPTPAQDTFLFFYVYLIYYMPSYSRALLLLVLVSLVLAVQFSFADEQPSVGLGNVTLNPNPAPFGSNVNASIMVISNYTAVYQIRVFINGTNYGNYTVNFTSPGIMTVNMTLNTSGFAEGAYPINFTLYNSSGAFIDGVEEMLWIGTSWDACITNLTLNPQELQEGDTLNATVNLAYCSGPQYIIVFTINNTQYGNHTVNCTGNGSFTFMVNVSALHNGTYVLNTSLHNMSGNLLDRITEPFCIGQYEGEEGPTINNFTITPHEVQEGGTINVSLILGDCVGPQYFVVFTINDTQYGNGTVNCTGNASFASVVNVSSLHNGTYVLTASIYNMSGSLRNHLSESFCVGSCGGQGGELSILNFSISPRQMSVGGIINASLGLGGCVGPQYLLVFTINSTPHGNQTINCTGNMSFTVPIDVSGLGNGSYNLTISIYNMSGSLLNSVNDSFCIGSCSTQGIYISNFTFISCDINYGDKLNATFTIFNCEGPQYRIVFTVNGTVYGNHTVNCTGNRTFNFEIDVSGLSNGSYNLTTTVYDMSNASLLSVSSPFRIGMAGTSGLCIRVIDPNGGEFLNGTNYTIRFNASSQYGGPLAALFFYSFTNDTPPSSWTGITTDFVNISGNCTDPDNSTATTNNCSILWVFDQWLSNFTIYLGIELKDLNVNGTAIDYSDGRFTVLYKGNYQPRALVVDPNGGENVTGLTYTIRFNVSDPDGDPLFANLFWDNNTDPNDNSRLIAVVLNLSNQSMCSDPDNTTATANNCSYVWSIDGVLRGNWTYIGVFLTDGISYPVVDYSDAAFFANSTQNRAPSLTVTSPISGTNVTGGWLLILFNVSDPDGDRDLYGGLNIDYDNDSGNSWNYSGGAWYHSVYCTDPDNDTRTPDMCRARISLNTNLNNTNAWLMVYVIDRTTGDYLYDLRYIGNITFTGVDSYAPIVSLTSPNGGEILNSTHYTIRFNVSDMDGNLMTGAAYFDNDTDFSEVWQIGNTVDLSDPRVCTDVDFNTSTSNNCSIVWDINTSLNNRTLWVGAAATDGNDLAMDYSNGNITINFVIRLFERSLTVGWNLISLPLIIL